ncbi:MAG: DedA family protein [Afipia sp.]|nr:DedA family protein [Afipia sp.]
MNSYLTELIDFVSMHALSAYTAIFCAALFEAIPIFGSIIPGSTVIVALSALIPSGNLKLTPVIAAAFFGAVIGDGIAYLVGYRTKESVLHAWPLSKYPTLVIEATNFFHRYGTPAVFFARFVPPVRAFVPIVAGALSMPPVKFFPTMTVAVALWAPAMVLPGVLAGSAVEQWGVRVKHYGWPLVGGIILIGALAWAIYHWRKVRPVDAASK